MLKHRVPTLTLPLLLALPALVFLACEDSDPVAIEGSTIILSASPNPVDLLLDPQGQSNIIARVESASGVPQEGVSVVFSITAGQGDVQPRVATTDSDGEVTAVYSSTVETNATLEARSGGVTKTINITVREGTPVVHLLNVVSGNDGDINNCGEVIPLTGLVLGSGGAPIVGAQVTVKKATGTTSGIELSISPTSTLTDSSGAYTSSITLQGDNCTACASPTTCTISIFGSTPGKDSDPLTITESL